MPDLKSVANYESSCMSSIPIPSSILKKLNRLYPNVKKWYGPYTRTSDGRAYVIRYDGVRRSAILVAKLKLEIKLKRRLRDDETVDHEDEDRFNDRTSNLQVLSRANNAKKAGYAQPTTRKRVRCPQCDQKFVCTVHRIQVAKRLGKKPCCTRSCASRHYGSNQYA